MTVHHVSRVVECMKNRNFMMLWHATYKLRKNTGNYSSSLSFSLVRSFFTSIPSFFIQLSV